MFKLNPIYLGVACSLLSINSFATTITTPNGFKVSQDVKHDVSLPLRYLQSQPNILNDHYPSAKKTIQNLIATKPVESLIPLKGFQGLGEGLGSYVVKAERPDNTASVGVFQFVQWVNTDIGVFNKATGSLAPGFPKPGNSLWAGFGGVCENMNLGSPTVKYDQLAERWVLSQHAYVDEKVGPFYQCIAVSTSEDATGSYHRYAFQLDSWNTNSRVALWPDAYYLASLLKGPIFGVQACALERTKMLAGLPATMQCKTLTLSESGQMIPADLDGTQKPPLGAAEYLASLDAPNNLLIYRFHVDFAVPANTTLTQFQVAVLPFKPACPPAGLSCAIQPNTTNKLNVYSYRPSGRFPYRQYRDYGSMVLTHNVEGPAPKFAPAIRWYELRMPFNNPNINPVIYQQATIAPDSKNRFMSGIAIDRFTNIAIGYNVTSSLIYPSLELASHNYNDAHNAMTIQPLVTGMGSQVDGISDWGQHSRMAVDPIDECTFWYTGEYLKTTGSFNWSTYILKFKLAACA